MSLAQQYKKGSVNTLQQSYTSDDEIKKAKQILGTLAEDISETELKDIVTEIHFLAESWLDNFEKQKFDGKTLREYIFDKNKDEL